MIAAFRAVNDSLCVAEEIGSNMLISLVDPTEEEILKVRDACMGLQESDFDPLLDDAEISRYAIRDTYTLMVLRAPVEKPRPGRAAGEHRTLPFVLMAFDDATLIVASQIELHLLGRPRRDARKVLPEAIDVRYLYEVLMATALLFQDYIRGIELRRMELVHRLEGKAKAGDLEVLHGLETDLVYFETALQANVAMLDHVLRSSRFRNRHGGSLGRNAADESGNLGVGSAVGDGYGGAAANGCDGAAASGSDAVANRSGAVEGAVDGDGNDADGGGNGVGGDNDGEGDILDGAEYDEAFTDILIEFNQALSMASVHRDLLGSTRSLFSDVMGSNLNDTMKTLTGLTVLLAVPTVITGFYGMNIQPEGMPFASLPYGFELMVLLTITVCIAAALLLKRLDML